MAGMVKCEGGCGRSIIAKAAGADGWTCFDCTEKAEKRRSRGPAPPVSDGYPKRASRVTRQNTPNTGNPTTPTSDGYTGDETDGDVLGYCARCGSPIPKFRGGRKVRADTKTCPDRPACRQWLHDERKRRTATDA